MRTILWTGLLGLGVLFGLTGQKAQAHWELRTSSRWSPIAGAYVVHTHRVWVPDAPVIVSAPPVVAAPIVTPPPVVTTPPVVATPVVTAPVPVVVVPRYHHRHHHHWVGYYASPAPVVIYPH